MIPQAFSSESSLVVRVKDIIRQSMAKNESPALNLSDVVGLSFGKMLRTRLACSVTDDNPQGWSSGLDFVCAAVELIHTASLFHDDVIDGASLRRGKPTLWKKFSPSGAVLLGDVIYCRSLMLLIESEGRAHLKSFVEKVHEVCMAESEQELLTRGAPCDFDASVRIARYKTGPLFALVGRCCGNGDVALTKALEEVGYGVGTAYQLADDLIDEVGDCGAAGKTLGTDRLRNKHTLAQQSDSSQKKIREAIYSVCDASIRLLDPWPKKQEGLALYLKETLFPACDIALPGDPLLPAHGLELSLAPKRSA